MDFKNRIFLSFIFLMALSQGFSQNFQGIYQNTDQNNPLVLSISEQGELLTGKLYQPDLSFKEFVARKEKSGFIGVFEVDEESEEVHGMLNNKSLVLTLKGGNNRVEMERLSKDLNYDFSKVFGEATNALKEKITGVWIEKEIYKMENGEKIFSELTGKEYMRAFNEDGKQVLDIRGLRDMEHEANKKLNSPQHLRPKMADFVEMSQMMSWKVVGNDLHVYPSQPIPGAITLIYQVEFQDEKMILKSKQYDWISIYERKE